MPWYLFLTRDERRWPFSSPPSPNGSFPLLFPFPGSAMRYSHSYYHCLISFTPTPDCCNNDLAGLPASSVKMGQNAAARFGLNLDHWTQSYHASHTTVTLATSRDVNDNREIGNLSKFNLVPRSPMSTVQHDYTNDTGRSSDRWST